MALRSITIAVKFGLTLFIARYLGLAELGIYGIITGIVALAPVLLGFAVSNNLGREAARHGPAAITTRLLQYFIVLVPIYATLFAVSTLVIADRPPWLLGAFFVLLILEHIQTDMFPLMTITDRPYAANAINFVRGAGWALVYVPLALLEPRLRTIEAVGLFWLAGCAVATILTVLATPNWRWREALERLPRARFEFPHRHGSTALYVNDVANTSFQYLDRYVVGFFLGPELLGVYVLFWSIGNAMTSLITTSVIQIRRGTLVMVAQSSPESFDRKLKEVTLVTSAMALGMSIAAIGFMYVVAPYIGRPEIYPYLPLMIVLGAGLIIRTIYEVIGIAFYAYGRDDITLYSGIVCLVAALVLNLSLDPTFGIWGAGFSLLASYFIGVFARALIISRGFRARALPERAGAGRQ